MNKFKCNYCGKEYDTPEGMAECIMACSEKIKREEEQKRINDLKAKQDESKKLIFEMVENRNKTIKKMDNEIRNKVEEYNKNYDAPITFTTRDSIFDLLKPSVW